MRQTTIKLLILLILASCGKEKSFLSIDASKFLSTNSSVASSPFLASAQESTYRNSVMLEGSLISFYHMNESSGTIMYDSKNANHGSYYAGASTITQGVSGALAGGGLAAYFSAPTSSPLGGVGIIPSSASLTQQDSVTLEFWTKMAAVPGDWKKPFFMGNNGSVYPFGVWGLQKPENWRCTNNGIVVTNECWAWQFSVVDPGPSATFATHPIRQIVILFDANLTDNNWHQVTAMFDNDAAGGLNTDVAKIYIDGVQKTVYFDFIRSNGTDSALESNNWLYGKQIGNYSSVGIGMGTPSDASWGPVASYFDEIAIYNGPLSPATVAAHYALRL